MRINFLIAMMLCWPCRTCLAMFQWYFAGSNGFFGSTGGNSTSHSAHKPFAEEFGLSFGKAHPTWCSIGQENGNENEHA